MASTTATRRSGRYYVTRNAEGKLIHVPIDDQRGKYYVARDANGKLIKVPMGQEPPTSASSIDNNTAAVAGAAVAAAKKKSKLTDAERTPQGRAERGVEPSSIGGSARRIQRIIGAVAHASRQCAPR